MQPSTTIDLKKTLDDLAGSSDALERRAAALALGHVPETSEEILRALMAAEMLDIHPAVRGASMQSLEAPVHQAYLEVHPDLRDEAAAQAERIQQQRQEAEEKRVTGDFIDRRRRMRGWHLGYLPVFALWWGTNLLPFDLVLPAFRIGAVFALAYLGYVLWWSWKNWRCPACDGWFGSLKAQVNPWFSSPPLRCPHCGEKLML